MSFSYTYIVALITFDHYGRSRFCFFVIIYGTFRSMVHFVIDDRNAEFGLISNIFAYNKFKNIGLDRIE